ncbi:MAG: ribonuclease toxin immunity protein CdiI [Candidatus Thiodiazotropha sp. L084R]
MDNKFRVVLEDRLLPVQVFFNAIPDRSFISTLKSFEQGVGAGFNDAYCGFPGEEDFDEEPQNGIEFAIKGEEVILDYSGFYSILEKACSAYSDKHPEQINAVTDSLLRIKGMLNSL